jgi:hypothetical protein
MGKKGDPRPQSSGGSTGSSGARCSTMWCEPNSAVGMMLGRRLRSPTFARGSCTPRAVRRPKGPLSHGRCRNPWWSIAPGHGDGAHSQPRQRGNDASLSSCPRGNIHRPLPQGPGRIDTTYLTRGEGKDGQQSACPSSRNGSYSGWPPITSGLGGAIASHHQELVRALHSDKGHRSPRLRPLERPGFLVIGRSTGEATESLHLAVAG